MLWNAVGVPMKEILTCPKCVARQWSTFSHNVTILQPNHPAIMAKFFAVHTIPIRYQVLSSHMPGINQEDHVLPRTCWAVCAQRDFSGPCSQEKLDNTFHGKGFLPLTFVDGKVLPVMPVLSMAKVRLWRFVIFGVRQCEVANTYAITATYQLWRNMSVSHLN